MLSKIKIIINIPYFKQKEGKRNGEYWKKIISRYKLPQNTSCVFMRAVFQAKETYKAGYRKMELH